MKRCQTCAEKIQRAARVCRFCQAQQPPERFGLAPAIAMVFVGFLVLAMIKNALSGPSPRAPSVPAAQTVVHEPTKSWVIVPYLDRHTCASERCGVVGRLFFREMVTVLEQDGHWARITQPYDANCEGGRSRYVDKGTAACTAANGVTDGRFAEWVKADSLSSTQPPDPALTAKGNEKLVAQSDDFAQHRAAFVKAANKLIAEGRCSASDFEEMGGWMKSTKDRDRPVYFMYCGGMSSSNRIYLNASNGEIYS